MAKTVNMLQAGVAEDSLTSVSADGTPASVVGHLAGAGASYDITLAVDGATTLGARTGAKATTPHEEFRVGHGFAGWPV